MCRHGNSQLFYNKGKNKKVKMTQENTWADVVAVVAILVCLLVPELIC